jgi:hypothetical protein
VFFGAQVCQAAFQSSHEADVDLVVHALAIAREHASWDRYVQPLAIRRIATAVLLNVFEDVSISDSPTPRRGDISVHNLGMSSERITLVPHIGPAIKRGYRHCLGSTLMKL